jgi:hypothetical protein
MPRRTLPMIDADGHVMEPAGMWERSLLSKLRPTDRVT